MDDPAGNSITSKNCATESRRYFQRDFWIKENLKFSRPHYRLEKSARIITRLARGKEATLLDVGCGPAALRHVLPPNIQYHGIDLAIQESAPNLLEADILKGPIRFSNKSFDVVIAQGVFEYLGEYQSDKLSEISAILNRDGVFIVSYWNYGHRDTDFYWAHSNIRSIDDFRQDLARYFNIDRFFPASHNWHHSSPNRKFNAAINMHINMNIPIISPMLAVEYFFLCSPLNSTGLRVRRGAAPVRSTRRT